MQFLARGTCTSSSLDLGRAFPCSSAVKKDFYGFKGVEVDRRGERGVERGLKDVYPYLLVRDHDLAF